jgi:hypothetical protein
MNNKNRLFFGLVSSLLLVCGFARAADHFDPLNRSNASKQLISGVAPDCGTFLCNADIKGN